MLSGLARRQLLQAQPAALHRSISSPAQALSFHPDSKASTSASVLAGNNEPATAKAERTLKRFWKSVNLVQDPEDQSWTIQLDKRSAFSYRPDFPMHTDEALLISSSQNAFADADQAAERKGPRSDADSTRVGLARADPEAT